MSASDPGGQVASRLPPPDHQPVQAAIEQQQPHLAGYGRGDPPPFFLDEKATTTVEIPHENLLAKDGWGFRRVLVRTVYPFPGACGLFSKLVRDMFPKATVGFTESGSYVCLFVKSASARDVDAYIDGILPLQTQQRVRLLLTSDVMFHVGCLRHALAALGEVRHLAIDSGNASGRLLFGRKATAVVRVPPGAKVPGTLSYSMGGLSYAVKVALHPEQSPQAPRPAVADKASGAPSAGVGPVFAAAAPRPASHAPASARKPPGICYTFRDRGSCPRDPCPFSHAPADLPANAPPRAPTALSGDFAPAGVCFAYYHNGKCKRKSCRFEHIRPKGPDEAAAGPVDPVQGSQAAEGKTRASVPAAGPVDPVQVSQAAEGKTQADQEKHETTVNGVGADCGQQKHGSCGPAVWASASARNGVGSAATEAISGPDGGAATPQGVDSGIEPDCDADALRNTRSSSDDSGDDHDACRHDELEVQAVEAELHHCVRCKTSWAPSSPSVMSCSACYGLLCDPCHRRLGKNASRRATKEARRQSRASRCSRDDSPLNFRKASSSS